MSKREAVVRGAGLVAASTVIVTVAFVGLLAVVSGETSGLADRFPFYVVVLSSAFTALILTLERYLADGRNILLTAVVLSITIAIVVGLDVEGILFAIENPDQLVASRLLLYLLAAGCLCTGLVYWSVHHWREFTAS
ncbi:hypothetical protein [Halapricum salinum]|uniref:Uncharacterized protein n=1 Tax=Halapricum salinum TaxID=1457250 RepID=A0A4D6HH60_9EURY|nr:hypothetical protein [Halapricum salinum]QCC52352.1 hypothetical protein DV733_14415 [Halapricum salinum]